MVKRDNHGFILEMVLSSLKFASIFILDILLYNIFNMEMHVPWLVMWGSTKLIGMSPLDFIGQRQNLRLSDLWSNVMLV